MTREEKQKAIDALKISAPIMIMTEEKFNDYIQTLNKTMDWLEQEPTTKNDLGVDCIVDVLGSYTDLDIPYKREIAENILTKLSSVTPQLTSELEKNSKKLAKDFGELDCISRAQTQTEIEMNASRYTIAKERGGMGQVEWSDQLIKVSDAVDIIRNLPSVTPQEPKTGHWIKGYTFPDGAYWKCDKCNELIKVKIPMHYCNNCGAKMVEPQESEG